MRRTTLVRICLVACFAPAQQPAAPQPPTQRAFRAGSQEVLLDIIARDKKNRPVTDLKAGDIEVFDNGSKRDINSFRLVEGSDAVILSNAQGAVQAPARQPLDPLRQVRLITLIFNNLASVDDRQVARNAALDLIRTELPQNVFMAVLVLDQRLKALQAFTNDRQALRNAIEEATHGEYTQYDADSLRIQAQLQQIVGPSTTGQSVDEQAAAGATPGNTGPGAAGSASAGANVAMAQMLLNMLQLERTAVAEQSGRAAITGLLDAVREQYRLPGRKSVFFISDGFTVPQGLEEAFRTVISAANRLNVTFYCVDARGLQSATLNDAATSELAGAAAASRGQFSRPGQITPQMAKEEDTAIESGRTNAQNYLAELATSTGGFLMANQNDFRAPMRRAAEDLETYYEVSYSPDIEKYDGSFRKVEVRTSRPGVRLYSRAGYFALPRSIEGSEVLAPYEVPLLNVINLRSAPRQFEIHSAALHYRRDKEPLCDIVLDFPLSDFAFLKAKPAPASKGNAQRERYQGEFAYIVLVRNSKGEVVRTFRGDVPLNPFAEQVPALQKSHFYYTQNFPLAPGRYTLETAVMDRKTEKFSVRKASFFMPAAGPQLAIGSIIIVHSVRPSNTASDTADPLATAGKLITPTLSSIQKSQNPQGLSFFTTIYPNVDNNALPQMTIELAKDGTVLGGGSPPLGKPDSQGRIQYVATIPIDKFAPGNYEIQFLVKQGSEQATEATTFTLE
jgi:VWFA-related protein